MTISAVRVAVRVSDALDRVVLTPEEPNELHRIGSVLKRVLPSLPVRRTAEGLAVRSADAHLLAELDRSMEPADGVALVWDAMSRRFVANRRLARAAHPRVHKMVQDLVDGVRVGVRTPGTLGRADVLDDHQETNVRAMTLPGGFGTCVFDEQGTGKTVSLIFAFDALVDANETDVGLIVAPKSMVGEWAYDFRRFTGDLYSVATLTGTRDEKMKALTSGADVLLTNFETVVSFERELEAFLRAREGRVILGVDESYHVKNLDAQRTRVVRRLREWCGRTFVLCGTPAPNSPDDVIQQFNIVDFGVTFDGVRIPKDRSAAQLVVRQAMGDRGIFVRSLKANVLRDLPAKRFHKVFVKLVGKQAAAYERALTDLVISLQGTDEVTFKRSFPTFLSRRAALLQICSNPGGLVAGYDETPAKLVALDALLDDAISTRHEKVIVWSFYTASVVAIEQRYQRYRPVRYDGSIRGVAQRREAVRRFQEDDDTMLFVGNPAAAGAGLTLHRARLAIYESLSNQGAHYFQSLDRIHRRGQLRDVDYVILLGERTIEVGAYDTLIRKEAAASDLLGDPATPSLTRDAMLEEALRLLREFEGSE